MNLLLLKKKKKTDTAAYLTNKVTNTAVYCTLSPHRPQTTQYLVEKSVKIFFNYI